MDTKHRPTTNRTSYIWYIWMACGRKIVNGRKVKKKNCWNMSHYICQWHIKLNQLNKPKNRTPHSVGSQQFTNLKIGRLGMADDTTRTWPRPKNRLKLKITFVHWCCNIRIIPFFSTSITPFSFSFFILLSSLWLVVGI